MRLGRASALGLMICLGGCAGLEPDPRSPYAPRGWEPGQRAAVRASGDDAGGGASSRERGGPDGSAAGRGVGPVPVQMVLSRGTASDSDANGYPDTVPVIAYLFPGQGDGALPVWSAGTFRFTLIDGAGAAAAVWEFPAEVAGQSERELGPGPGYSFFLRLADGQDVMKPGTFELVGEFVHAGGAVARGGGGASVRLGAGAWAVPVGPGG